MKIQLDIQKRAHPNVSLCSTLSGFPVQMSALEIAFLLFIIFYLHFKEKHWVKHQDTKPSWLYCPITYLRKKFSNEDHSIELKIIIMFCLFILWCQMICNLANTKNYVFLYKFIGQIGPKTYFNRNHACLKIRAPPHIMDTPLDGTNHENVGHQRYFESPV